MPFRLFHDLFPEVAERETRNVILPSAAKGLPAGAYAFKEMFCDEPGCDCRRVFLLVEASFRDGIEAVIAWGWEDLAFYRKWLKYGDEDDARDLIGPILNPMSPETELAPHLLNLFKEVLLNDADYFERIKRHYRIFRDAIEKGDAESHDPRSPKPEASKTMNKTKNEMKGECFLCHASIPKTQATRHVKTCLKKRNVERGRSAKALHLKVEGKYNPEYWMHIEIPGAATLYDLDAFLRRTWLECCHHMSCFTIGEQRYAYEPFSEGFRSEKSMSVKLYKAIPSGTKFTHEYDYGSTTDLFLRTMSEHESVLGGKVRILARNVPPEFACTACGKPATIVRAGLYGLNTECCYCTDCSEAKIDDEGMRLPIVNSPRTGVCAYCG